MDGGERIAVIGPPHCADRARVEAVLEAVAPGVLLHGGAEQGVDRWAAAWAERAEVEAEVFPAQYEVYASHARELADSAMLHQRVDRVLIFAGCRRSERVSRLAETVGVPRLEVDESPERSWWLWRPRAGCSELVTLGGVVIDAADPALERRARGRRWEEVLELLEQRGWLALARAPGPCVGGRGGTRASR